MHIAIIRHSIRNRGSDRSFFIYADYLIRQGHKVVYYTNDAETDLPFNKAIEFRGMPIPGKLGTILFILFAKLKEDVVLIDLIATACLSWILNRKRVIYCARDFNVTCYSSAFMQKFMKFCYTVGFEIMHIPVISVDEKLSEILSGFHPKKLITAPNGVDLGRFCVNPDSRFFKQKKEPCVILLYAREEYRKGLDVARNALHELAKLSSSRNWEVWVIGDTVEQISDVKMTNHGFLDFDSLRDILSATDIFLLPSRSEGLSPMLLQALACECAIVATEAANVVVNKREGLISPIEDYRALAINLDRLLDDAELRETLKKNARALAEQYSLEESCRKFEEALNDLNPFP